MPKYVIEREMAGAGKLGAAEFQAVAQKSCDVLRKLGTGIQWLHSYVTDNKVYCVYYAENEDLVRKHAKEGGFPVNSIAQVRRVIDPASAEG